jgi:hypothetical protein
LVYNHGHSSRQGCNLDNEEAEIRQPFATLIIAAIATAVVPAIAVADHRVVPHGNTTVEGNSNNVFPFSTGGCCPSSFRYQQVFAASEFGRPRLLTRIAFRADGPFGTQAQITNTLEISLSTTAAAPDGLSATFANNVGSDATVVYSGSLTISSTAPGPAGGPRLFDIVIVFQHPFLYDPSRGNLLLEVKNFSFRVATSLFLDSQTTAGDSTSRVYAFSATADTAASGDTLGLIARFGTYGDGDFDGDGNSDITVYRPSAGAWYIEQSSTNYATFVSTSWGTSTDIPVPGDYDGDLKADVAVYRPSTGAWYILTSSSNFTSFFSAMWGTATDVPVPGDYDGDGKTDVAVYRPSTGAWYILTSSSNFTNFFSAMWGNATDVPVAGDFDGDGKADIAVWRAATGTWFVLKSNANYTTFFSVAWGATDDVAAPGDYDGDGKIDLGVFRRSTGVWWVLLSSTNYATFLTQSLGASGDAPVPGDYDGDGRSDIAVFRPSTGDWLILTSSSGYVTLASRNWGTSADIPINKR